MIRITTKIRGNNKNNCTVSNLRSYSFRNNNFHTNRRLRGCILDIAGTIEDPGCYAPVYALQKTFKIYGINISVDEARGPMGMDKKSHIREILKGGRVYKEWKELQRKEPHEYDVDQLYEQFQPIQLEVLKDSRYTVPIPGALQSIINMKFIYKMKIGLTTGYNRQMLNIVIQRWKDNHNFFFNHTVSSDEVKESRPNPEGCFKIMDKMELIDPTQIVKIGDTSYDIREGRNAGMWAIGVTRHSSSMGMNLTELWENENFHLNFYKDKLYRVRKELLDAGAHYVIDDLTEVMPVIKRINNRVKLGENSF